MNISGKCQGAEVFSLWGIKRDKWLQSQFSSKFDKFAKFSVQMQKITTYFFLVEAANGRYTKWRYQHTFYWNWGLFMSSGWSPRTAMLTFVQKHPGTISIGNISKCNKYSFSIVGQGIYCENYNDVLTYLLCKLLTMGPIYLPKKKLKEVDSPKIREFILTFFKFTFAFV